MSEDRGEEWELSKENIKPIQQGNLQQQSYENELRTYSGDDPLAVWCKYIKWAEHDHPKGSREGYIKQLIERCLSILRNEKKYINDDRFIDIMLKYATLAGKPSDVYTYMFSNNIGCKSAKLYINWSQELEQLDSCTKADEILIGGIQSKAEPFENLLSYYKDFKIRNIDKIKGNSDKNLFSPESSQSAFTMLKSKKKNSTISKTGEEMIENRKIPLALGRQQPQPKSINASAKVPFKVHDSENINPSFPPHSQFPIPSNLNSENYKENEQKLSKCSKVKKKTHDQCLKTPTEVKRTFKFYCDDENKLNFHTPRSVPKNSKILHTHSQTPIALFEPEDPLKKPMYPKSKVYSGGKEFSLEEIRAAEWFNKQKRTEQEMLLLEQQKKIEEQKKAEERLKEKVEYLEKQVEFLQLYHLQNSGPKLCKFQETAERNTDINGSRSNGPNKKLKSEKNKIDKNCELHVPYTSIQNGSKSQLTCDLDNSLKIKPLSNSNSHDSFANKEPDGTGFCAAAKIVQELYNGTLSHSVIEDEHRQALVNEFSEKCSVASSTNLSDLNDANQHEDIQGGILKESTCDLPFTFYHDPTGMITGSKEVVPSKYCLGKEEDPFVLPNEASSEEDIENIPPKGYMQESSKRELAGILQPSKNILFIPLEEQEDVDDNSDIEENYICHDGKQYTDDTLIPPSNTEQFRAAQFISSTPYVPKSKNSILETSGHQIAFPDSNDVQITQHLVTENPNTNNKECDQDNRVKTELKVANEQSSRFSKMLSVIMETSAETYSKSSSSSSSSLTRSNNLDQHSSHRISTGIKQYSKLETCELGALSSISEVPNDISDINSQNACEIPQKFNEIDQKVQLHTVDFDPFDQEINNKFLKSVNMNNYNNLNYIDKSMKGFKEGENICIGNESYRIISLVAEGAYAKVYVAVKGMFVMNINAEKFALKVCKKSDEWELYICNELKKRLSEKIVTPDIRSSVMNVISAAKFSNGIILVTNFSNLGTLLDIVNFCKKQNSAMPELIVMYFTLEILLIVSRLHECNIIHGDIKPDNILLTNVLDKISVEKLFEITSLQLIDFGRAIDLSFYNKGICFTSVFSTNEFKCNEMKDKRPWVFQLDWYGVASCIHTMLFSDYIVVKKKNGVWGVEKRFKRYWCVSLWDSLFNKLLNIPECYQEPDIQSEINVIKSKLQQNSANFLHNLQRFVKSYETGK